MAQHGDETILDEAKNLLVQGKRFMALEDYQSATDSLEQSCQLFDAFYGVAKRECADAYLEYGLALVALANIEAGSGTDKIMKKAGIEGEEEEEEGEYEEEEEEEEGEAADDDADGKEDGDGEDKEKNENKDIKMDEDGDKTDVAQNGDLNNGGQAPMEQSDETDKKTNGLSSKSEQSNNTDNNQPQPSASSSTCPEPTPGTSGSSEDGKDGEDIENEEATTIEVAWEVLCLAKRLYMTDESLEGRLKLAETLQKIGEISIEWDNNDNAVSILEECLKIRTAILPPHDRLIALTYYHLGLAHSFKSEAQDANENFEKAINVIETRIETLTKEIEKVRTTQDTVEIGSLQKEINELKELLPDMTMRLDDSKEDGAKSTEALKRTREEMQQEDEEVKKVCLDKSKPVDDISHLVKRKAA